MIITIPAPAGGDRRPDLDEREEKGCDPWSCPQPGESHAARGAWKRIVNPKKFTRERQDLQDGCSGDEKKITRVRQVRRTGAKNRQQLKLGKGA